MFCQVFFNKLYVTMILFQQFILKLITVTLDEVVQVLKIM